MNAGKNSDLLFPVLGRRKVAHGRRTGLAGFKAAFFQLQPWACEFSCSQQRCKGHRNNDVN